MTNILKTPEHQARLSHHSYDMDQSVGFSAPVGLLQDCYHDILNVGEKIKVDTRSFSMTDALSNFALNKFTEHLDFFFVPYTKLFSYWKSFRWNTEDLNSSVLKNAVPEGVAAFPQLPFNSVHPLINGLIRSEAERIGLTENDYKKKLPYNITQECLRLLENAGVAVTQFNDPVIDNIYDSGDTTRFNPQFLLAYQAIYNDFYRLGDWESRNEYSYNIDRLTFTPGLSSYILKPRFRPWVRDLFTNVYPQPLYTSTDLSVFSEGTGFEVQFPQSGGTSTAFSMQVDTDTPETIGAQIQSLALQRYLQISRFAKKSYAGQALAHFGFKVPQGVKDEVYYLGSHDTAINVQSVEATAAGSFEGNSSILGELGGRALGVRNGSRNIEFTAPCDGIFMVIHSIVPEAYYPQLGLDKENTYQDQFDWFNPEFDNTGMVPLFRYELAWQNDYGQSSIINFLNQRFGWRFRYSELKQKINKVRGNMSLGRVNDTMLAQRDVTAELPYYSSIDNVQRFSDILYISPSFTDQIALVKFKNGIDVDGEQTLHLSEIFATDPFRCKVDVRVIKTSVMKPYGLINL